MKKDLHVHLHGCLSPEDLWHFGKDTYKKNDHLLQWYSSEYQKAWERKPDYKAYWETENGLELLSQDYLFLKANPFSRFQANFNLIIALCQIITDDFKVQEHVIRKVCHQGIKYFEARVVIPFRFSESETKIYLQGLCSLVKKLNCELAMTTKLVVTLSRSQKFLLSQYSSLQSFLETNPKLAEEVTGIDFACNEEGDSPKGKKDFFRLFQEDNKKKKPLELLYHVGESFTDKGMQSAIRWIYEIQEEGANRLGHAIALGLPPETLKGTTVKESKQEALDTFSWLIRKKETLALHGYMVDENDIAKQKKELENKEYLEIFYDDTYIDQVKSLQKAVLSVFKEKRVVIEVCPSSNMRIAGIKSLSDHPLRAFHLAGVQTVLGTDDPGIFATNLENELKIYQKIIALSNC